ncbi:ATP/GTP-binding protein [Nitrosomonas sp.]|uniref:AAA family ATPase n=1 Tax=Nitrosomonas sp. TaxID=42353 RepID=UPI00273187B4|nr:ATP-binding protein [Nitrosomonas sp.]MDP2223256.1 ATP-binding protein [Nitrosomonas sp.]
MLIEFNVSNFLSIREQASLSMVAAKGLELANNNTFLTGIPAVPSLLRSAAIYGANAAGKSNFIKALQVMRQLVLQSSAKIQADEKLPITPFLLDEGSPLKPSEFEVTFINQGIRYQYGFSATPKRIIEEWLLAYPSGKAQRWIERRYDEQSQSYRWGGMGNLTGKKELWKATTRSNALFLSTAMQLNNQQLSPVFSWFDNTLHVAGFGRWHPGFSMKICEKDNTREQVIAFLKAADVDINDIELEKEKFDPQNLPDDIPEEIKRHLEKQYKDKPITQVKTVHTLETGRKILFDLDDESDGTQKIFALAGPWLDTLENGYILVIDELHDNLHPLMVKFLVGLFHNPETNPKNAQLIFTTHDTSILNQKVFRRDQIWFCEKDSQQVTTLYPLTDFSPRKGVENLEHGYLSGRYGALPYLASIKTAMAD